MQSPVLIKSFSEPEINLNEIFRYSKSSAFDEAFAEVVKACISECIDKLTYSVCYAEFPIDFLNGEIVFPFMRTDSVDLIKNLSGSKSVIVFAATVGLEIDRLIAKYGSISPVKALAFQAIGAERIESLCNAFCTEAESEYKEKGLYLRPRFSAGYGDFSLEYQRDIFAALDCPRKIGLTLNESLIMSPSKSVTAIVGISEYDDGCEKDGCESCLKKDCDFKRGLI